MSRVPGTDSEMPATCAPCATASRQRYGCLPYNHAVLARRPSIFRGFRAMWNGLEQSGLLARASVGPGQPKSRIAGRLRPLNRAELCLEQSRRNHGCRTGCASGPRGERSFSERERAALAYAEAITTSTIVPEELYKRVQSHFSDDEIVDDDPWICLLPSR